MKIMSRRTFDKLICAISIICLAVVLVLVLVLVLGGQVLVLVLVLGGQVLVLVLVLEGQVLVNIPANNGLMHLFSQISYSLSNQEIEKLFHPGQATTMLGLLKYPNDFQLAQGLNQLWYKDSTATAVIADNSGFAVRQAYLIRKPDAKGTFSF